MAEARNEALDPTPPGRPHTPPPAPDAATGDYAARGKRPADIERDIDHTRAEMSETLDAIGARFEPDYIKEQAKDALRSTARDAGSSMLDTVRDNPVPAIIAGLSIGWLVAKGGESERDRYHRERYEDDYHRRYGRYPAASRTRYRAGYDDYRTGYGDRYEAGDHERHAEGRSVTDRAGDKAAHAKDKAGDLADQATDRAQDFADDARRYGRRAENWLERQMNESPLAMGAVALAAGALVGLAVPETRKEDEWMGQQSDRLKHQAKQAAEEKLDQAKRVAEATAEEAKDKAEDVAETAKKEAKKQDLDEPPKTAASSSTGSTSAASKGS
jgi:ElaB/YqjD/DUF883 family membrane-anchored ribosome-binding protein